MHEELPLPKRAPKSRVKVAIRVRPMINRQSITNEDSCVEYPMPNRIVIGKERSFNFDKVFPEAATQQQVYQDCVKDLVMSCFDGYNAAVLAYGQTGSGKTYTMGTSSSYIDIEEEAGVIPRVITTMFEQIEQRKQSMDCVVKVSFIQIYNEQIIDLLSISAPINSESRNAKNTLTKDGAYGSIREEKDGSISVVGVIQQEVTCCEQMLSLVKRGGHQRSTSSTLMNSASSRSHGIFTIYLQQHPKDTQDNSFITAKFYFVDLAGSERAKKTGASGQTFKQGININLGLLELGNVISALSASEKKDNQFITYRNSKLTRILQDSLGGNSNTYMIACISPAESNYEESLNTLKYATKAMNIKNTPVVNRDPHTTQINALKQRIIELECQNNSMCKLMQQSGVHMDPQLLQAKRDVRSDILSDEIKRLKGQLMSYEKTIDLTEKQLKQAKKRNNQLQIQNYELRREKDKYRLMSQSHHSAANQAQPELDIVDEYLQKIRQLQTDSFAQQRMNLQIQSQYERLKKAMDKDEELLVKKNKIICALRDELKKERMSKTKQKANIEQIEHQDQQQNQIQEEQQQDEQGIEVGSEEQKQLIEAEVEYLNASNQQENKLDDVDQHILDQERQLHQMTEDQIILEYQLISEMKEEYHKKIWGLEKEKQMMIKQQQEMVGYEKNPKLLSRIDSLEMELRQLRKKAKEQLNLQKQVSLQNEKIKKLANEIKQFRLQKIEITRKIKQEKNAYDKFKKERMREILREKKDNANKEKQIRKLLLENKRKSMQIAKRVEEANRAKKINMAIKSKSRAARQNKAYRQAVPERKAPGNTSLNDGEMHFLRELNSEAIKLIFVQEELRLEMSKYDERIIELDQQIDQLYDQEAALQLKLDRLRIHEAYQMIEDNQREPNAEITSLEMTLADINGRRADLNENIAFLHNKFNQLGHEMPDFHYDLSVVHHKRLNSMDKYQYILSSIFGKVHELVHDNIVSRKECQRLQVDNQQLRDGVQRAKEQLMKSTSEHQLNLGRLREEMMARCYQIQEEQEVQSLNPSYLMPTNTNSNKQQVPRLEQRERKVLEKKIIELNKTNRQLGADVEMWRRKCSVVQEKYHNMNTQMAKDKFIGLPHSNNKKGNNGWNIGGLHSSNSLKMLNEVNDLIEKFDNRKRAEQCDQELFQMDNSPAQYDKNKWECIGSLKVAQSAVLSLASFENNLVTSATKSLTVWDQENFKIVADLSNPNLLQGLVRKVFVIPEYHQLVTACEKQVFIWDYRDYSPVSVLRSHREQVRSLHSVGYLLLTAGKGSSNCGALHIWDLRNLSQPLEEKERNLDIFAQASYGNTLFYGTRTHQVRRMNLDHLEILAPFEPPHMDTVTSLTILGDYLVSGSRDKNLRMWSMDGQPSSNKCTMHTFNDYINAIHTDPVLPVFYSASRDGQVKIAKISASQEKIKFVGGIIGHTQSINDICSVGGSQGTFATGSSDRTVKFWRPQPPTLSRLYQLQ